ncbi:MAG TPA: Mu transposase C-terminal domain-containing protein [Pyrinomonadaceae bacterium]
MGKKIELYKNMVYEWLNVDGPNAIERLLWTDRCASEIWTIRIYDSKAQPVRRDAAELKQSFLTGEVRVLAQDPFAYLSRPESEIKEEHRQHRDKSWELIAPLVENGEEAYRSYSRDARVTKLAEANGCAKSTIYRNRRRYFQRGQTKNSQLPLFDQCGWRNRLEPKASDDEQQQEDGREAKKLGRPSTLSAATSEPLGVNITKKTLELFRAGIKLFYERRTKRKLTQAFQLTLEKFFNIGYYQDRNGVWVPALPPASERPTYRQFKYWYYKERQPRRAQIARDGVTRHNLSGRAKLGDSTQMAVGPGSIFQIDATIGDVYLVSSLDRNWIIGRPVIYFVIDVFSRLIVGLSVALEGPSWLGAMLALENVRTDKVVFCAEYGISIEESEWPVSHLPEALMADRGELEGYNADHLVNAFNITVHNTAPYRGDLKGIVEQHIDLSNEKIIHWIPGRVRKRERGDRDYRLDATLTLHEFQKLMVLSALDHNNEQRLNGYRKDEYLIADHVEPYPIDLWNWGIRNRSGHLCKPDIETVRLNLLPEAEASVTQNGISFASLKYSSELAQREQWFERAGENGSWKIRIAHDPRTRNRIYLRLDGGKRVETCHLLTADKTFLDRNWYETVDEFELQKQRAEHSLTRQHQSRARFHAATNQVVTKAQEQLAIARVDTSDRARVAGIRENRKHERQLERNANAWELGADPKPITPEPTLQISAYVPPPQPTDKLRMMRQRRLQK